MSCGQVFNNGGKTPVQKQPAKSNKNEKSTKITFDIYIVVVKEIRVHTLNAGNVILLTAAAALQEELDKTVIE